MAAGNGNAGVVIPAPQSWRLKVFGEPGAWQRPGAGVIIGADGKPHARMYSKAKTRRYEDIVRQQAAIAWRGAELISAEPIVMRAEFHRSIPASWSQRKRRDALLGLIRPITKPDIDNYVKAIKDGLSGVVYADDSLIVSSSQDKFYSSVPRVEITLTWGIGAVLSPTSRVIEAATV